MCSEHHDGYGCSYEIGEHEVRRIDAPPPRSRVVAEIIAVFDHALPLFSCSFLDDPIRIDRSEANHEVAYKIDACAIQRTFRVACPNHGSIDPDNCHVSER